MKCSNCGGNIPVEARYCDECGTAVSTASPAPAATSSGSKTSLSAEASAGNQLLKRSEGVSRAAVAQPKLFISYRRDDDASGYAIPPLRDKLVSRYGREAVFYDIDNIPLGVDFRDHLSSAIAQSSVVLVVIGEGWAGYDAKSGKRRIDDENDFVRIEIEAALLRDVRVIPVMVGKAAMPTEAELPPSLGKLAYRNAAEIRKGKDYEKHMSELLDGLDRYMSVSIGLPNAAGTQKSLEGGQKKENKRRIQIDAQDALDKIENAEIRSRINDCIERGFGEFKPDNCRLVLSGAGLSWNLNGQKYGVYLWQPKRFENDIALYQKHGLAMIEEKAEGKSLSAKITSGADFDNLIRLVKGMQTSEANP